MADKTIGTKIQASARKRNPKPAAKTQTKPVSTTAVEKVAKPAAKSSAKAGSSRRKTGKDIQRRIEEVRAQQRAEGNFDCFGTATEGYCDQEECSHLEECLPISQDVKAGPGPQVATSTDETKGPTPR